MRHPHFFAGPVMEPAYPGCASVREAKQRMGYGVVNEEPEAFHGRLV